MIKDPNNPDLIDEQEGQQGVSTDDAGEIYSRKQDNVDGVDVLQRMIHQEKFGNKLYHDGNYKAQVIDVVEIYAGKEQVQFEVIAYVFNLDNHIPKRTVFGEPITPSYIKSFPGYYASLNKFRPQNLELKRPAIGEIIHVRYSNAEHRRDPVYVSRVGQLNMTRHIEETRLRPADALREMKRTTEENIQKALRDLPGSVDSAISKQLESSFGDAYAAVGADTPKFDVLTGIQNNIQNKQGTQKTNLLEKFISQNPRAIQEETKISGTTVMEVAYAFNGGPYGSYRTGYGLPIDVFFANFFDVFFVKKDSFISSFGYTWTVLITIANNRKKLNNFPSSEIKKSLDIWRRANIDDNISALNLLSLGYRIEIDDCAQGDFIQFYFNDGRVDNKQSAIFLNWILNKENEKVGFLCRGCFEDTNSISDVRISFSSIDIDSFCSARMRDI